MLKISGILLILKFYFPYLIAISRDIKINQSSKDALPYQQLTATKLAKDMHLEYFPSFFWMWNLNYFLRPVIAACDVPV